MTDLPNLSNPDTIRQYINGARHNVRMNVPENQNRNSYLLLMLDAETQGVRTADNNTPATGPLGRYVQQNITARLNAGASVEQVLRERAISYLSNRSNLPADYLRLTDEQLASATGMSADQFAAFSTSVQSVNTALGANPNPQTRNALVEIMVNNGLGLNAEQQTALARSLAANPELLAQAQAALPRTGPARQVEITAALREAAAGVPAGELRDSINTRVNAAPSGQALDAIAGANTRIGGGLSPSQTRALAAELVAHPELLAAVNNPDANLRDTVAALRPVIESLPPGGQMRRDLTAEMDNIILTANLEQARDSMDRANARIGGALNPDQWSALALEMVNHPELAEAVNRATTFRETIDALKALGNNLPAGINDTLDNAAGNRTQEALSAIDHANGQLGNAIGNAQRSELVEVLVEHPELVERLRNAGTFQEAVAAFRDVANQQLPEDQRTRLDDLLNDEVKIRENMPVINRANETLGGILDTEQSRALARTLAEHPELALAVDNAQTIQEAANALRTVAEQLPPGDLRSGISTQLNDAAFSANNTIETNNRQLLNDSLAYLGITNLPPEQQEAMLQVISNNAELRQALQTEYGRQNPAGEPSRMPELMASALASVASEAGNFELSGTLRALNTVSMAADHLARTDSFTISTEERMALAQTLASAPALQRELSDTYFAQDASGNYVVDSTALASVIRRAAEGRAAEGNPDLTDLIRRIDAAYPGAAPAAPALAPEAPAVPGASAALRIENVDIVSLGGFSPTGPGGSGGSRGVA